MLSGAGFGDDAFLAHAFGEQGLAYGVVDLVGAGVEEILAFEIDFRSAQFAGQALGVVERGGSAAELAEVVGEFALKLGVVLGAEIFVFDFLQRMHQCFGHKASPIGSEMSGCIGQCGGGRFAHGG